MNNKEKGISWKYSSSRKESEIYEFGMQNAVDYINDNLEEWQLKMLNEMNFNFWHWISLCLQEKRISIQDVENKMNTYIE